MEQDKGLKKLIKDHGIEPVTEDFTSRVMDRILAEPVKKAYKPIIGKGAGIFILVFFLVIISVSLIYGEPSGIASEGTIHLPEVNLPDWKLPQWKLPVNSLPEFNITGGALAALIAVFTLVVFDALITRRKRIS